jgi:hypothetical protein
MVTWSQQQAEGVKLRRSAGWTVATVAVDPPDECSALYRAGTREPAEAGLLIWYCAA